jgi:hypothetical protein
MFGAVAEQMGNPLELRQLRQHIRTLAALEPALHPVVSCYINVEPGCPAFRSLWNGQVRAWRRTLPAEARSYLEAARVRIEAFLSARLLGHTRGVAVFARGGDRPFFLPLQFRAPLPNRITVNSVPSIYPLVELKDTYDCYLVMLAATGSVRLLGVHLGSVVEEIEERRVEFRQRTGREWTRERHESHRRARIRRFLNDQIALLERVAARGGYGRLVLAGNPRLASRLARALPHHLAARLVDIVPASEHDRTEDIVAATLSRFIEREEQESLARVTQLVEGLSGRGSAVAGVPATLEALAKGQAGVLVLAQAFVAQPGRRCVACGAIEAASAAPQVCLRCGGAHIRELDVREEMVRMAEQTGCEVEVVRHSEVLMRLGGAGCLLRFLRSEQYGARAA